MPQYLSILIPLLVVPIIGTVLFIVLYRIVQIIAARHALAQNQTERHTHDTDTTPPLSSVDQVPGDVNVMNGEGEESANGPNNANEAKNADDDEHDHNDGDNARKDTDAEVPVGSGNNNNNNTRGRPYPVGDSIITVSTSKAEEQAHETLSFASTLGFTEAQISAAQDATTKGYSATLSLLLEKAAAAANGGDDANATPTQQQQQQFIDIAKACAGFTFWTWLARESESNPTGTAHVWTKAYAQKMGPELVRMARNEAGIALGEDELYTHIMEAVNAE